MLRGGLSWIAFLLVGCLVTAAAADMVTINGLPSYPWYDGCGPTAAGMIIGYWDGHGYTNLIPGSADWNTNQQALKDMIASPGHIRDYADPNNNYVDRVPTPSDPWHPDDSVADFNSCSRDPNAYGWSTFGMQRSGLSGYSAFRGYSRATAANKTYRDGTFWTWFVGMVNAGKPVELNVDTDANGMPDHFVAAFGYDNTPGAWKYAAYNTWDQNVHWYDFSQVGHVFGIYGGTGFDPGPLPGDSNGDGKVDGGDLAIWQQNYDPLGLNGDNNTWAAGDWNGDGKIDGGDLALWQQYYAPLGYPVSITISTLDEPIPLGDFTGVSEVPEPASLALLSLGLLGVAGIARRRRSASCPSARGQRKNRPA